MAETEPKRYLVIRINHSNAGFFAYVNFALNQLVYAERHGLHPVVFFGPWSEDGDNPFYDPELGENIWDYYFEPVAGLTYADLMAKVNDPGDPTSEADLVSLGTPKLWAIHNNSPDSVYPYPHGKEIPKYEQDPHWYETQRRRAHELMQRYVRVKPHIATQVERFFDAHFAGYRVIGTHIRGTDKGTAPLPEHLRRIVKPQEYFRHIDDEIRRNGPCKIFVATDQRQFLTQMKSRYGDLVLSYDSIRVGGLLNPFQIKGDGYKKGEDVLIDCLLLSRCDLLFKCASAVGEFAVYFNAALPCVDLNEQSKQLTWRQRMSVELRHKLWFTYLRLKGRL